MERTKIAIISEPTIVVLAEMKIGYGAIELARAIQNIAPECMPEDLEEQLAEGGESGEALEAAFDALFPHERYSDPESLIPLKDNELLVELAGRKCYNSFGLKAGQKENAGYIANLLGAPGKLPHASVLYHAKMTFFFAGISRRMSHELIRHYVGADRSEEGCPSQESTRYTHHNGHFIAHPRILELGQTEEFRASMQDAYDAYTRYVLDGLAVYEAEKGKDPTGMARKRIYEAAASYLPGSAATSMLWTTNPMALQKIFTERCDEASDLEFQRFAKKLRDVSYTQWPNLFRESNPVLQPTSK